MAGQSSKTRKPWIKLIGYGVMTASCYAGVFLNADSVMNYFTRGQWYAALPIATVFLFSFVHGAFAANLWTVLGIQANQRQVKEQPKAIKRPSVRRRRPQPRLRLTA